LLFQGNKPGKQLIIVSIRNLWTILLKIQAIVVSNLLTQLLYVLPDGGR
jgi:hypothetical protein